MRLKHWHVALFFASMAFLFAFCRQHVMHRHPVPIIPFECTGGPDCGDGG
jgi:hypothetical protein